jgi:hypothetical protein
VTKTELAQMRQKWEAFGSRLKEGDGVEGSLIGASFIIARSGVTDVLALLDHFAEVERTARGLVRGDDEKRQLTSADCPYCPGPPHGWGMGPDGLAELKRRHDAGHPDGN